MNTKVFLLLLCVFVWSYGQENDAFFDNFIQEKSCPDSCKKIIEEKMLNPPKLYIKNCKAKKCNYWFNSSYMRTSKCCNQQQTKMVDYIVIPNKKHIPIPKCNFLFFKRDTIIVNDVGFCPIDVDGTSYVLEVDSLYKVKEKK